MLSGMQRGWNLLTSSPCLAELGWLYPAPARIRLDLANLERKKKKRATGVTMAM